MLLWRLKHSKIYGWILVIQKDPMYICPVQKLTDLRPKKCLGLKKKTPIFMSSSLRQAKTDTPGWAVCLNISKCQLFCPIEFLKVLGETYCRERVVSFTHFTKFLSSKQHSQIYPWIYLAKYLGELIDSIILTIKLTITWQISLSKFNYKFRVFFLPTWSHVATQHD